MDPPVGVTRQLSQRRGKYFQSPGTQVDNTVPQHSPDRVMPLSHPILMNLAQSHRNGGWRPVDNNLLLASRTNGAVQVNEIQPYATDFKSNYCPDQSHQCTIKQYPAYGKPDLCNFKSRPPYSIEIELNEVSLPHRDIPLHRSPGKTDLTQSNADFREAARDADETEPSIKGDTAKLFEVQPDVLFKSKQVLSLNRHNFQSVVDSKVVTLILFYHPDMPDKSYILNTFAVAACSTKRAGHAYAAVNCLTDQQFCVSNQVKMTPTVTMYSFGNIAGSFPFNKRTQDTQLRNFVEQAHAFQPPRDHL